MDASILLCNGELNINQIVNQYVVVAHITTINKCLQEQNKIKFKIKNVSFLVC